MARAPRRVLVDHVPDAGESVDLPPEQARHVARVLRLAEGAEVELFDAAGRSALAVLSNRGTAAVVREATDHEGPAAWLTVYCAVPKGNRADWCVEKLSELGVNRLVWLETQRGVVEPGQQKLARHERLAAESAKQSRRPGVMSVEGPVALAEAIAACEKPAVVCSTADGEAFSLSSAMPRSIFIGPEGGWTPEELANFASADVAAVKLTGTVLRVETAALAAAAVVLCGAE